MQTEQTVDFKVRQTFLFGKYRDELIELVERDFGGSSLYEVRGSVEDGCGFNLYGEFGNDYDEAKIAFNNL